MRLVQATTDDEQTVTDVICDQHDQVEIDESYDERFGGALIVVDIELDNYARHMSDKVAKMLDELVCTLCDESE